MRYIIALLMILPVDVYAMYGRARGYEATGSDNSTEVLILVVVVATIWWAAIKLSDKIGE